MRQPLTRLNLGSYGHCSCTNRCAPLDASTVPSSSKEAQSLAIEAWQPGYCAQTFARPEIECDHFVLGYAVKPSIQPQAALPESQLPFGLKKIKRGHPSLKRGKVI
jgi:hypothetical protein